MKDLTQSIKELQDIQEQLEADMKFGLSEKLQNIIDEITISNQVEKPVSPTERNSFGQWILCEDKMPRVCESVIVCDPKQPRTCKINEAFWDGEEWNFIRDGYEPIQITKWMPLPKP